MSVDVTGKHWLLQNERVLQALAAHPERTVSSISAVFAVKREELQAWLDKYNGGKSELTVARIHAVKTELGLLTVERAGTPAPTKLTDRDDGMSPWTKRVQGPREGTLKKYRSHLEKQAAGGTVDDNGPAWLFFLNAWLGSRFPAATRVKRFLAWADVRNGVPVPEPAEKPKPAARIAPTVPRSPEPMIETEAPEVLSDGWIELICERPAGKDDAYYNAKAHNPVLVLRRPVVAKLAPLGMKAGAAVALTWNRNRGLLGISRRSNGTVQLRAEHGLLCIKRKDLFRVLGPAPLSLQMLDKVPAGVPAFDLVLEVKPEGTS